MIAGSARCAILVSFIVVVLGAGLSAAPATAGPSRADVVRLPFPSYDGTLTPYTFELGYPLVTLVYDTVMWRDRRAVARPWLAASVTRSRAGSRVTVRLRPGVRWHDGRPLTAADVAFTFRHVAAHYHPRFTPQLSSVERVRASDRLTVTFDLRDRSPGFEDQPLADVPILPQHLWEGLPAGRRAPAGLPVGSGPYRLVSAERRGGYVLRRSRRYFRGAPRVREIRVPIIRDAQRTYKALRERRVDMVPLNLPRDEARRFSETFGVALRRGPSYAGTTLLLNLRRPPFNRPAARRALANALDVEQVARVAGSAVAAVEGHMHPASRWAPGTSLQRFDLDAARRTLERLRIGPIRILTSKSDPVKREAGRQVMLGLRRAGVRATLVELSSARLGRAIGESGSEPDFDAAIHSLPALVSHNPDFLSAVFGSDARDAPLNFSEYRSQAFDALARRVTSAPDLRTRKAAAVAQLRLLARDLPSIPLFFSEGTFAFRPTTYDGWTFVKGTGILDKRSFLPQSAAAASGSTGSDADVAQEPQQVEEAAQAADSGAGIDAVDMISIVVLVAVLLLAAYAILQRRPSGRR